MHVGGSVAPGPVGAVVAVGVGYGEAVVVVLSGRVVHGDLEASGGVVAAILLDAGGEGVHLYGLRRLGHGHFARGVVTAFLGYCFKAQTVARLQAAAQAVGLGAVVVLGFFGCFGLPVVDVEGYGGLGDRSGAVRFA